MRKPLLSERVRTIKGSFAFIEHRFLRHNFWASLSHHELLLYFFLIMVGDRQILRIVISHQLFLSRSCGMGQKRLNQVSTLMLQDQPNIKAEEQKNLGELLVVKEKWMLVTSQLLTQK